MHSNNPISRLSELQVEALLITNSTNVQYLSGFKGDTAWLIVPLEGPFILITDGRFLEEATQECPTCSVVSNTSQGNIGVTAHLVSKMNIHRLGIEADTLTVNLWQRLEKELEKSSVKIVPLQEPISSLRQVKTTEEISTIKQAIQIAEVAFTELIPSIQAGVSEKEIAHNLISLLYRHGADGMAFDPIVASGPNGARPHHQPTDRLIQRDEFVTIDWGARRDGYCSDLTRTIYTGPNTMPEEFSSRYAAVLESQQLAIQKIRPGLSGAEVDKIARDYLEHRGLGDAFIHALGHSLGREVHDGGRLSSTGDQFILQPNMIVTVEPGIYLSGWGGIRIEDDVLVTESGCTVLSSLPK